MIIAVLALQGAFIEHENILHKLNVETFQIRKKSDLNREFHGLVLPGGESTTMGKLLEELDLLNDLKMRIESGLPVLGTCAGLILLASKIADNDAAYFKTLPVTVIRNAYGRQLGSFCTEASFGDFKNIPMKFIRAPYIKSANKDVKVLSIVDGRIVAVQYRNQLGIAFHPELTDSDKVHQYFIDIVKCNMKDS